MAVLKWRPTAATHPAFPVLASGAAAVAGLAVPLAPMVALVCVSMIATLALALALHTRFGLSPVWLLVAVAVLQPWNGVRPLASATLGDLALVMTGMTVLVLMRPPKLSPRLIVPLVGVLLVIAGGLLGAVAVEGVTQAQLITAAPELGQLTQARSLLGAGGNGSAAIRFFFGAPCVLLILAMVDPSPRAAAKLGQAYALGSVASVGAALLGYSFNPGYDRAVGLAAHFLHFGLTSLFGFAVAIGWFVSARSGWSRLSALAVGGSCFYGVLLSGARSALIGCVVVVLYFALLARGRGIIWLLSLGLPGAVGIWLINPYLPQGSAINRLLGQGPIGSTTSISNDQHVTVLQQAFDQVSKYPITGTGFSAGLAAHNLELEAMNVGGVLGLLGIVFVWSTVMWLLFRQLRYGIEREDWLRASLPVGLLGYFCLAQFENIFWDRHLWFFLTLALIAAPEPRRVAPHVEVARKGEDTQAPQPSSTHAVARMPAQQASRA